MLLLLCQNPQGFFLGVDSRYECNYAKILGCSKFVSVFDDEIFPRVSDRPLLCSSFKANVAIIEPHCMTSTANQLSGFCMKGAFIVNAVSAASLFFKSKREHLSN